MGEFDFILDGIRYSYSSVTTHESCNYAFKLAYIEMKPRINNFFGEYGTLIHECLEQYFMGNLDSFELSQFYEDSYKKSVLSDAPSSFVDLNEKYKREGKTFFDNFSFEKHKYDVVMIEDKIDFELGGIKVVAKPDLVLREKETGLYYLIDYKTAVPFSTDKRTKKVKQDTPKIEGYMKQMYLYTHALEKERGIPISEIQLWFARAGMTYTESRNLVKELRIMDWFSEEIKKIKDDTEFIANTSNPFFCNNLCGVRESCEFREK